MIRFLQNLSFTDEEIASIEQLFFGDKSHFNPEQHRVLNCFSRENIQACPGSGKTTTLAAKLLLLKSKMHKGIKGGICILTHTNVAVEMIKDRLGSEGTAFYSNYPNYLGTIQSFVNKFLAIPAYKQLYNSPIEAIDDEVFFAVIGRRQRSASNAAAYLSRNKGIDHLGVLSFNIHNFDISDTITTNQPIVGKHTTSYQELERLKLSILSEGFFKYDEAYSLAFQYMRDHPKIQPLFSRRFPLVFLDEMQDTEEFQFLLLNQLFASHSIFQTIGDGNQDIFGHYDTISAQWPRSTTFSIATSSRFPQHIADTIQTMGVEQQTLVGNQNPETHIPPHIIVYNDSTIHLVKNKFGEIIIDNGLHTKDQAVFKAVGARKDAGQVNIASYFPEFNKNANKIKEYYSTMDDYLNALTLFKSSAKNIKGLKNLLSSLLLQVLKHSAVRDTVRDRLFTSASFERYLKFADPNLYQRFRLQMEKSIGDFLKGEDIKAELTSFIRTELLPHFSVAETQKLSNFISEPASAQAFSSQIKHNIFEASHAGGSVDLIFDTIHGVKGETHTGTLYLETYNRTFDIQKLLPLIAKVQNRTSSYINANKTRMKQAYVAMSRPTNLLCLAVHADRIDLNLDWSSLGISIVHC